MGGAHHTGPTPAMGCPCCRPCVTGLQEAWTEEGATPSSSCHWACGQESGHSVGEGTPPVGKCARPGRCGNAPCHGDGGPFSLIEEYSSRWIWGTGVWGLSGSRLETLGVDLLKVMP